MAHSCGSDFVNTASITSVSMVIVVVVAVKEHCYVTSG